MPNYFTLEELTGLKRESLVRLAEYYHVNHKKLKKGELAKALFEMFDLLNKKEEPQMSVRIRRIKESSKNG